MESDFQDDTKKDDDWGRPPSPLTPENQKKAFRAQLILGITSLVFIALPGILFGFLADPKEMYSTTHKNKKGFCKFELLLIILLVLIGAFLSIPLINSLTSYTDVSGDNNEQLDSWNRFRSK